MAGNIDIQPVFNEYKAVAYMCQYFSKTKYQKQAVKEAFENNIHDYDTMKTIAKAYLSNRECSAQEAVFHILQELKLRRFFPAVYFLNTIFQRKEFKCYFLKKNLADYQIIAQIFSRDLILIVTWKDQVQHSPK